jgi:hypothetical protein
VILGLAVVAAIAVAIPATGADNTLKNALGIAKKANKKSARALKVARQSDFERGYAGGSFSTSSNDFVAAPDGPRVTVEVLGSGLIEVVAGARVDEDAGIVSLYRNGVQVPGQAQICGPGQGALFQSFDGVAGEYGTPAGLGLAACATNGAPGPVYFSVPPGTATFELRYAEACPCATATFSHRRLLISPRR